MNSGIDAAKPVLTRRQALGCLGLGAFSFAVAALCLTLGVMCMAKHDTFQCIGLWSVFPLAFVAIGLVTAAVGLQRFTSSGRGSLARPVRPATGSWEPIPPPLRGNSAPGVIYLPGRLDLTDAPAETAEDGTKQG